MTWFKLRVSNMSGTQRGFRKRKPTASPTHGCQLHWLRPPWLAPPGAQQPPAPATRGAAASWAVSHWPGTQQWGLAQGLSGHREAGMKWQLKLHLWVRGRHLESWRSRGDAYAHGGVQGISWHGHGLELWRRTFLSGKWLLSKVLPHWIW